MTETLWNYIILIFFPVCQPLLFMCELLYVSQSSPENEGDFKEMIHMNVGGVWQVQNLQDRSAGWRSGKELKFLCRLLAEVPFAQGAQSFSTKSSTD